MALKSLTELVSDSLKAAAPSNDVLETRLLRSLQQLVSNPVISGVVGHADLSNNNTVRYTLQPGVAEQLYGVVIPEFIHQYSLEYMGLHGTMRLLESLLCFRDPKLGFSLVLNGEGRYLVQLEEVLGATTPIGRAMAGLYSYVDGQLGTQIEHRQGTSLGVTPEHLEEFEDWLADRSGEDEEFSEHEWYTPKMGTAKANYGDFDSLYAYLHCIAPNKEKFFVFNPTFRNGETNYKARTEMMDLRYKDAGSATPYGFIVHESFTNRYVTFFNHAGVELSGNYYAQAHALRSIYERFTGLPQTHQTLDWARTWEDEDSTALNLRPSPQKVGDDTRLIAPNGFSYSDL